MACLTEGHTCTRIWQYDGPRFHRKKKMLPVSVTPDTCQQRLADLGPLECHSLEMSPPPCRSVRTFTVKSPRLSIFSPPGATCRCPFTELFDGFRSTFGQSSGFTTGSPALESTVISRYRPRLPSVATGLLSIDVLPIVTAFKSTSSGHHSPTLELSLGRSSHSLEMSYCHVIIGRRWYTPSFWHTEQTGKFAEKHPFTSGTDFAAKRRTVSCFPSQQSWNGSSSSR